MRRLTTFVATFAFISSHAWAFDPSPEVVGQMYFSIPLGAVTKQEAALRLGFRVGYGEERTIADRDARLPYGVLDLRSNLDGQTTLLLNGVDVGQLSRSLYAAEDEAQNDEGFKTGALIGLGIVIIGGVVYLAVKVKDCVDNVFSEDCNS